MKALRSFGLATALTLCTAPASAQTAPVQASPAQAPTPQRARAQAIRDNATGDWRSTVDVGAMKIRVMLHLGETSTFDSPDQGAVGLPALMMVGGDGKITIILRGAGQFEGTLSADGKTLTGALVQGAATIPVTFERGVFPPVRRPQTPKAPFPYRAEEVAYDNPAQPGVRLAGTLTIPQGKGPHPVALLISGSGTQDRNSELFEHKPFLLLADTLTRRGIAVLRVDDRGIGGSRGGRPGATTADFATDVEAGVAWLKTRPDIDHKRIGLIGHSEGGLIAPMVASRDPGIAFLVLWAAPGVNGKEVIIDQARTLAIASGSSPQQGQRNAQLQRAALDAFLAAPNQEAARSAMNAALAGSRLPPVNDASVSLISSPWYRYFMQLEPAVALKAVRAPVLALFGTKDTQVSPEVNQAPLRAALAGNRRATVDVLPGLNHLFQTANTGAPAEYGTIEETIAPVALDRMVEWVASVAKVKKPKR